MDFPKLCHLAVFTTMILALVDFGFIIAKILFHFCVIPIDDNGCYSWTLLYQNYLAGSECKFSDDKAVSPVWYFCDSNDKVSAKFTAPRSFTSSDATFIWVIVRLVMDLAWIGTAIAFAVDTKGCRSKHPTKTPNFVPWCAVTGIVLVLDLVVAVLYSLDVQEPVALLECTASDSSYFTRQLLSVVVFPLLFSRGVLLWFVLFVIFINVVNSGVKIQEEAKKPTMFGDKSRAGRSVSEALPDNADIRFQHTAIPEDSAVDVPTAPANRVVHRPYRRLSKTEAHKWNQQRINEAYNVTEEGPWGHHDGLDAADNDADNDAGQQDNDAWSFGRPNLAGGQQLQSQAPPRLHQSRSETSPETLTQPKPRLSPPESSMLRMTELSIPRAKVVQKPPRKVIRTGSKAAEYYQQDNARKWPTPLPDEGNFDDVERYFVKLKQ